MKSDHDILVNVEFMVTQLWDETFGNGRPGIVGRVTLLEAPRRRAVLVAGGVGGAGVTVLGALGVLVMKLVEVL